MSCRDHSGRRRRERLGVKMERLEGWEWMRNGSWHAGTRGKRKGLEIREDKWNKIDR